MICILNVSNIEILIMISFFNEYFRLWLLERLKVKEVEGYFYFLVGVFGDVFIICLYRD